MNYTDELGQSAKTASKALAAASAAQKNKALAEIADRLIKNTDPILSENAKDLAAAKENGISDVMQDRLRLTPERIKGMADSIYTLIRQSDPIGITDYGITCPNGMKITRISVPLGVICIIYESRPNVTSDAGALCLKSGNAVILRGGKEAYNSNKIICAVMREAVKAAELPEDSVQFVDDTSRETSSELMKCNKYIDLLIPRGGGGLIRAVKENSTVPVIETGTGNCHLYVDKSADLQMAANIADNGKTQRPSVCNALETLLVHKDIAEKFLPMIAERFKAHSVELRGCPETRRILGDTVIPAADEDYATEFLDYIIAVKVVENIDEAIAHISRYSSGHSECIVTNTLSNADKFKKEIDAACVYVNASTRFTDGGEFGLGAEIGISTQKMHVRGPMGLSALTSYKYLIDGNGQIR